ncbi:MAG: hypothetical protein ACJ8FY_05830 [Gemmataceae bacterium]
MISTGIMISGRQLGFVRALFYPALSGRRLEGEDVRPNFKLMPLTRNKNLLVRRIEQSKGIINQGDCTGDKENSQDNADNAESSSRRFRSFWLVMHFRQMLTKTFDSRVARLNEGTQRRLIFGHASPRAIKSASRAAYKGFIRQPITAETVSQWTQKLPVAPNSGAS